MIFRRKKEAAPVLPPSIPATEIEPLDDGTPRKKILVIDDDQVTLKALSFILKNRGYKVVTATDGSQAIGLMRDEEPDMMLVDVGLPPDVANGGMCTWDGFQVTQWIRQINGRIPTIFMSANDKPEYKKRASTFGAQAFLAKPIDNQVLLASIASALSTGPHLGSVTA